MSVANERVCNLNEVSTESVAPTFCVLKAGCHMIAKAYSGTQSRRNFGRLKATLGDFSLFCPKLRAILGDLRRFWATLGDFGRF